jgi:hypothetical protein
MGGPGDIDQRRARAQLFRELYAVRRQRDLILSSLQDQVLGVSGRCPPDF